MLSWLIVAAFVVNLRLGIRAYTAAIAAQTKETQYVQPPQHVPVTQATAGQDLNAQTIPEYQKNG